MKVLPAATPVKLLKRQGFWVEVDSGGATGWVKLSDLGTSSPAVATLAAVDTGRTGKGNIVSTSAARGLSARELTAARPDLQQFEQLRAQSVSAGDAESFAQAAGLKVRSVSLLAAAPPGATASTRPEPRKAAKAIDGDDEDE